MASFLAASSAVADCRAERIGEVTRVGLDDEASLMRSASACSEMVGWESPRRTRLMEVGE
jgi:hypothetical protein